MKAGTTPSPAAVLCVMSMPSAMIAHAAVMTMPAMKATLVRPGARPSITARGSKTGAGVDSVIAEAYWGIVFYP